MEETACEISGIHRAVNCFVARRVPECTGFQDARFRPVVHTAAGTHQDLGARKKLPEKHTSQGGKGRRHLSGSDWTQ